MAKKNIILVRWSPRPDSRKGSVVPSSVAGLRCRSVEGHNASRRRLSPSPTFASPSPPPTAGQAVEWEVPMGGAIVRGCCASRPCSPPALLSLSALGSRRTAGSHALLGFHAGVRAGPIGVADPALGLRFRSRSNGLGSGASAWVSSARASRAGRVVCCSSSAAGSETSSSDRMQQTAKVPRAKVGVRRGYGGNLVWMWMWRGNMSHRLVIVMWIVSLKLKNSVRK